MSANLGTGFVSEFQSLDLKRHYANRLVQTNVKLSKGGRMLFEIYLTKTPTKDESDRGESEVILAGPYAVLAEHREAAIASAVASCPNPKAIADVPAQRLKVYTREFK